MNKLPIENCLPDDLRAKLAGKKVLVTGASGFVGRWMYETAVDAGALVHASVKLEPNDRYHGFDYYVHATTDGVCCDTIAGSARSSGGRMLCLSSGAVYGSLHPDAARSEIPNSLMAWPDTEYGKEKLRQENACADVAVICRLFSFIGPGLRRHTGREFLEADPIRVRNDGAVRSYLYAGDLAWWLWAALIGGKVGRCYNVGSSVPTKVISFANICGCIRGRGYFVEKGAGGTYYVPDTTRIRTELGVRQRYCLEDAVRLTLAWMQGAKDVELQAQR